MVDNCGGDGSGGDNVSEVMILVVIIIGNGVLIVVMEGV